MTQRISQPVSVHFIYNHEKHEPFPRHIRWNGRTYKVKEVGLHHTYRQGRTLYHIFSVASETLFFRLILDTDTLHWKLEEIADKL